MNKKGLIWGTHWQQHWRRHQHWSRYIKWWIKTKNWLVSGQRSCLKNGYHKTCYSLFSWGVGGMDFSLSLGWWESERCISKWPVKMVKHFSSSIKLFSLMNTLIGQSAVIRCQQLLWTLPILLKRRTLCLFLLSIVWLNKQTNAHFKKLWNVH